MLINRGKWAKLIAKGLSTYALLGYVLWFYYMWFYYMAFTDSFGHWLTLHLPLYVACGWGLGYLLSHFHIKVPKLYHWFFSTIIIFIPIYGLIASVALATYFFVRKDAFGVRKDDPLQIQPMIGEDEIEEKTVNELIRHNLNVRSYADILRGNNLVYKKLLLTRFLDNIQVENVPLLRIALTDEEYEIRTFASTVLSRHAEEFDNNIVEAKTLLEEEPESFNLKLRVIRSYVENIASTLLDAETAERYRAHCQAMLNEINAGTMSPRERHKLKWAQFQLAKLEPDLATRRQLLETLLAEYPDQRNIGAALCETLFKQRDMDGIRWVCKRLSETLPKCHPAFMASHLWRESA